jgi:hypothetical protein
LANKNRYKYRTFKVITIQVLGFLQQGSEKERNEKFTANWFAESICKGLPLKKKKKQNQEKN